MVQSAGFLASRTPQCRRIDLITDLEAQGWQAREQRVINGTVEDLVDGPPGSHLQLTISDNTNTVRLVHTTDNWTTVFGCTAPNPVVVGACQAAAPAAA